MKPRLIGFVILLLVCRIAAADFYEPSANSLIVKVVNLTQFPITAEVISTTHGFVVDDFKREPIAPGQEQSLELAALFFMGPDSIIKITAVNDSSHYALCHAQQNMGVLESGNIHARVISSHHFNVVIASKRGSYKYIPGIITIYILQ